MAFAVVKHPIPFWLPVDGHLALGAQPDADGLRWLRDHGYDLVINLNTPDARNYWPEEAKQATEHGMKYVHMPLDCSTLTPEKYESLRGLLRANNQGRTFLHCAMNIKSSGMAHIYRIRELGHEPAQCFNDLRCTPGHEPKWRKYWEAMGAV